MSVLSLVPDDKKNRKESIESVYSGSSRLSLLPKRKKGGSDIIMSGQSQQPRGGYVTQRVLSAKTHRVKQLQNQLADAHFHLQELSNENRVLKVMQKKHEIALSRYENSNAELPQVLNSHSEELRIQQAKYKQLRQQHRENTSKLKERDLQLQQLRLEHQHLLDLTKDRNLPEREKLQLQVTDMTVKIEQQNNTISMLQRKLALEAKNFRHQLQVEMGKHKDTRHDLDLAISNADKLSTIIEMKEKLVTFPARRSPTKQSANVAPSVGVPPPPPPPQQRPLSRTLRSSSQDQNNHNMMESLMMAKLCENSRNLSSAMSRDEDTTSSETRMRSYSRSRTNSTSRTTPNQTRKNSKESDDMIELAKTVQDGMADLSIFDEEIDFNNTAPEVVQKKINTMKEDLLHKIKNNEEPVPRLTSAVRKYSAEETIEEVEEVKEVLERPKSRGRSGNVSFFGDISVEETSTIVAVNHHGSGDEVESRLRRETSTVERKSSAKPLDKSCTDIIQNIERSNRVIDRHMKEFSTSKLESDKLVEQLQAVDKISNFMSTKGDIPQDTLTELNNNFKMLTNQAIESIPVARKRSVSSRRSSVQRSESNSNLFGDSSMSNQDMLEDLLGKK